MTLYLIDASGLVHRAFHAIRGLTDSKGTPTNAIFGLASMLKKFLADNKPTHCAVVLDVGRETFRTRMYEQYKANRPETDPALAVQFKHVPRLAAAMGFKVLSAADYEADDIIATLTARAVAAGMDVVIESGDKDLFQLVGDRVTVHEPMNDRLYDRDGVKGKLDIYPEFVRDYLSLVGDSSDNVPGVPGIGAKGAAELVNSFGHLEDILNSIDALPNRAKTALEAHADLARLSMKLVTLDENVPLTVALEELTVSQPDRAALIELYTELEFRKLLAEVQGKDESTPAPSKKAAPVQRDLLSGDDEPDLFSTAATDVPQNTEHALKVTVANGTGLKSALEKLAGRHIDVAFAATDHDTGKLDATGGAGTTQDLLVAALADDNHCLVFSINEAAQTARAALQRIFLDWSGAGFKELTKILAGFGITPATPRMDPVLAAYVMDGGKGSYQLAELAAGIDHASTGEHDVSGSDDALVRTVAAHAAASRTLCLKLGPEIERLGLKSLLNDVEIPLAGILGRMELLGVEVDKDALAGLSRSLGDDLRAVEKQIMDAAGFPFNPASPKQLAEVLFERLGLPVGKKTKSGQSTDVKVLEELADLHPVPRLILEYRTLAKLKGTYADALHNLIDPRDGRIHTTFNQTVTATGRLSSSDPNLQNIPVKTPAGRKIRHAFRAAEGRVFVSADYSQIELRVLAHYADDPSLIAAFADGRDIHTETASKIYKVAAADVTPGMRRIAKVVNFGLLYGMGPFRLAGDLKIPQADAKQIIADYFNAFPGIRVFLDQTIADAKTTGYATTIYGRRRHVEDVNSPNHQIRTAAERATLNMPVQGTAADIVKIAMVNLDRRLRAEGIKADIVLQVHDELVLESDLDCADYVKQVLVEEMQSAATLRVPLTVEPGISRYWDELH
jgi:DNA polymerase-1